MALLNFSGTSCSLTLFSQGSPHNILPHIILLSQVEELADLAGPLGSKAARDGAVGQTGNVLLACDEQENV